MDSVEAQRIAGVACERGWDVRADFGQFGWWLLCVPSDGGGPRYARSQRDVERLIAGGVVARLEGSGPWNEAEALSMAQAQRRPGEVSDLTLRDAIELLESLGDHVGNVDPRTGLDRCRVILNLREAQREREAGS